MFSRVRLTVLSLLATTTIAHANTTRFFSATNCLGNEAVDNDAVKRSVDGCTNNYLFPVLEVPTCAIDAHVTLPITGNTNESVNYDGVNVNYLVNDTAPIFCTVSVQNSAGTVFSSSTLHSAPTSVTPLIGTMSWTGAALPNAGNAIAGVRTQSIFCTLPPLVFAVGENCFSAHGHSFVTSYSVNTVQP